MNEITYSSAELMIVNAARLLSMATLYLWESANPTLL